MGTLCHPPETKTENVPSQVKALANVKIVQVMPMLQFDFQREIMGIYSRVIDFRPQLEGGIVWLSTIKAELTLGV